MSRNFQREGAISNTQAGKDFETIAMDMLAKANIAIEKGFSVEMGIGEDKKKHEFDFGADDPPVIVECKSHTWTAGGNTPSAKITVWNEAMYYFLCSPRKFRKIFCVSKSVHDKRNESLAEYYVRTRAHLIPPGVEIWELDEATKESRIVWPPSPRSRDAEESRICLDDLLAGVTASNRHEEVDTGVARGREVW